MLAFFLRIRGSRNPQSAWSTIANPCYVVQRCINFLSPVSASNCCQWGPYKITCLAVIMATSIRQYPRQYILHCSRLSCDWAQSIQSAPLDNNPSKRWLLPSNRLEDKAANALDGFLSRTGRKPFDACLARAGTSTIGVHCVLVKRGDGLTMTVQFQALCPNICSWTPSMFLHAPGSRV